MQRRRWHPTPVLLPGGSHGRRSLVGCTPWGRWESDTTERLHFHSSLSCIREGNGNPLQCSCLENPRDGREPGGLQSMGSLRVSRLSDFTFTFHFHAFEKEMATHSSVLTWRIPGTGEPGRLPSMGSHSRTRLMWFSSSSSRMPKWQYFIRYKYPCSTRTKGFGKGRLWFS